MSRDLYEWYQEFHKMREAIFDGSPEAARNAREFYRGIVGDDAIVRLTLALRLRVTEGGQDWDSKYQTGSEPPSSSTTTRRNHWTMRNVTAYWS